MLGYTTLWFIISYNTELRLMPFSEILISQGSVATSLRLGGIFKREFVANWLPNPPAKNVWNRSIIGEVTCKSLMSCFLTHSVYREVARTRSFIHAICSGDGRIVSSSGSWTVKQTITQRFINNTLAIKYINSLSWHTTLYKNDALTALLIIV